MNLESFLKSKLRNAWIREPGISLYVRKSIHPDVDIDLASLEADIPGKGALTAFLNRYEKQFVFRVESILNERLEHYLKNRGYSYYGIKETGCVNMVLR